MKKYYILMIFVVLFGCRTLSLNQKAETIKKTEIEVSGTANVGAGHSFFTPYLITYIYLSTGIQYRYGVSDNAEFQFKMDLNFNTPLYSYHKLEPYLPGGELYYENTFKLRSYKGLNSNFSFLPYFGILFGMDYAKVKYYGPSFGITTGLKLIGDYKNFYYGFPMGVKFYPLATYYPEIEAGFSLGGEYIYKDIFVLRNEFSLLFGIMKFEPESFTLTAAYSLAVGKRFSKKQKTAPKESENIDNAKNL
jgi:hypothetical protein